MDDDNLYKYLAANHRVKVNRRYVFFQSLENYTSWWYPRLAKFGELYTKQAKARLDAESIKSNNNQDSINKIKDYINYIKSLAETELKSEKNFIKNFRDKLDKLPEEEKNKMNSFIDALQAGGPFNYIQYLKIINEIMAQNKASVRERQRAARESMEVVRAAYQPVIIYNKDDPMADKIKQAFNLDYGKYKQLIMPKLSYGAGLYQSKRITALFNQVMQALGKDNNLANDIVTVYIQHGGRRQPIKALPALVFKYLSQLDIAPGQQNIRTIIKDMKEQIDDIFGELSSSISDDYIDSITNELNIKTQRTLEEIALTTRQGLGKIFLGLDPSLQQQIIAKYGQGNKLAKILNAITGDDKKKASKITKYLGNAIREYYKTKYPTLLGTLSDKYNKGLSQQIQLMLQQDQSFADAVRKHSWNQTLVSELSTIEIDAPQTAEGMGANIIKDLSPEDIKILMGGGKIKKKTDISWTYTKAFSDAIAKILNDLDEAQRSQIVDIASNFHKNFIETTHAHIGDEVNAEKNITYFEQTMRDMRDDIMHQLSILYQGDDIAAKQAQVLEALNELMAGGVQVKEYNLGGDLGFHGGSLGPNSEKIIANIDEMYNIGGISRIDQETLYFVLINCGVDGVAAGLEQDLAHYLLGGAMMLLFDEGFTASNAYLNKIKTEFHFAPSIVHLFNLQGGHFVPASFVYTTVYNSLLDVYADIVENMEKINKESLSGVSNKIHIINNITEEKTKPSWTDEGMQKAQTRWDIVSNAAQDQQQVDVRITFLAGILDIFEAIPDAFNISI